jgi:hypothetical protein
MSETDKDMANVEAWAEVVSDMLSLMEPEQRLSVLHLATEREEKEADEREKAAPGLVFITFDEASLQQCCKHWNVKMRLRSLIVQVFVRRIRNNHSPKDAAKILFARHRHGNGSGELGDYIDDLPRRLQMERTRDEAL